MSSTPPEAPGLSLRVLVSTDCRSCTAAAEVVSIVLARRPDVRVQMIDVDVHGVPDDVAFVGTPMYVWGSRVVSLGNPEVEHLLAALSGDRP